MLMEEIWGLLRIERLEQLEQPKMGMQHYIKQCFGCPGETCLWFCFCQQKLKFRALIHDHQDKFKQSKE
jgi:hypothetical protein